MNKIVEYIVNGENSLEGTIHIHKVPVIVKNKPPSISIRNAAKQIAKLVPSVFFMGLKKVVITDLASSYEDKPFNAFYSNRTIFVSYRIDSELDFIDDVIHELAHHVEKYFYKFVYGDGKIKEEFGKKREKLFIELKSYGMQPPPGLQLKIGYDAKIDKYLYQELGYDKLFNFTNGLFLTPYSATSLREYFAITFEKYFLKPDYETHKYIKKISPTAYNKILELKENLDESPKT
jgi:hypothetical protein